MLNATANTWKSGIMGNERIEVPQNPNLAFASAPGLRDEGSGSPTSSFAKGLDSGVWLFVGGHDGLVHEHIYNTTNNTWRSGMTFEGANGYSGAYVSRGLSVLSVTVTNSSGYLDHWLKDFSSNGTWAQHNEDNNRGQTSFSWYNASYATNTSICAPNNIFLQEPGGKIASVGFRLISDYVKYQEWQQSFGISNGTALNGTGIGCHYFEDTATMHRVFYQDEDGDVIEATRNYNTSKSSSQLLDAGKYTYSVVPLD